jgi:hypothetical protein
MPLISAIAANPQTSAKVTRFEIVMVKRSLEAANAIKAGNTRSRIASVNIIIPLQQAPNLGAARCGFVIVIAKMPFTSAVAKAAAEVNSSVAPHGARSG